MRYTVVGLRKRFAMILRVAPVIVAGATALLASCSTAPPREARIDPVAQQKLAKALAGRTAGRAVLCLPAHRTIKMDVIDDWNIVYRDGSNVYLQNPRGGCPGLANGRYALVSRKYGTNHSCDGDINQLVDLTNGVGGGSCVFGPFVPYTKI